MAKPTPTGSNQVQITVTDHDYQRLTDVLRSFHTFGNVKGAIRTLSDRLLSAFKVRSEDIEATVVTMNSIIVVEDLQTHRELTLTIVYPEAADIGRMRISILSPNAVSLFGNRVGDVVKLLSPTGATAYRINQIVYQPEAAKDFHV